MQIADSLLIWLVMHQIKSFSTHKQALATTFCLSVAGNSLYVCHEKSQVDDISTNSTSDTYWFWTSDVRLNTRDEPAIHGKQTDVPAPCLPGLTAESILSNVAQIYYILLDYYYQYCNVYDLHVFGIYLMNITEKNLQPSKYAIVNLSATKDIQLTYF